MNGCGTCNGSGIAPDHSPQPDDEQPCPECMTDQQDKDMRELFDAAARQVAAQAKARRRYLAALLADTRPNDEGTEGEWANRLWEAGVHPPLPTPRGFTDWGEE